MSWDCHNCMYHMFIPSTRERTSEADCGHPTLTKEEKKKGWDGCGPDKDTPCSGYEE